MAVRQYVGARYVPKFADPVGWQSGTSYEALTIVTYNNSSYTSKIPVPATVGNPADNDTYWALTGNYNAQVEAYREETVAIQENLNEEVQNRENTDTVLGERIDTTNQNVTTLSNDLTALKGNYKDKTLLILGDSWTAEANSFVKPMLNFFKTQFKTVVTEGIGGARIAALGGEAQTAYDAGIKPDIIFIIAGTNDVWHDHAESVTSAMSNSIATINSLFPTAEKHYFPNNSATANQGYNRFYNLIPTTFAQNGITPHVEMLSLLARFRSYYQNLTDATGLQHLTGSGMALFGEICLSLARGGIMALPYMRETFNANSEGFELTINYGTVVYTIDIYWMANGQGCFRLNLANWTDETARNGIVLTHSYSEKNTPDCLICPLMTYNSNIPMYGKNHEITAHLYISNIHGESIQFIIYFETAQQTSVDLMEASIPFIFPIDLSH